ncbi:MAG: YfiR family protein [Desulfuromonadaceae bacterium]|nr:YfiR family protein [Desulfuromonadaceae bacterium]
MMRALLILLMLFLMPVGSSAQGDYVPREYIVKAKYLLNIPLFVDMPTSGKNGSPFTICLIGDTPLESILAASKGKLIKNRPLAVKRVEDISQVGNCQMLFIASSERHRLQVLLPEAHSRGILTVSDMRDFARLGGMISLLTIDNRVTYDLNRTAAGKASISFSTQLLKLARDIIN